MFPGKLCFILNISILCAGFAQAQQNMFQLLTPAETGVSFRNDINETENLNVLAYEYFYNGGAVAVGDINNDGLQDIFFTSNMGENKLYLNLGGLKFKDITAQAGPGLSGRKGCWKTGATMADVNGDGLLDIYVCYSGKLDSNLRRNQLFINQGSLKFEERGHDYGVDDPGYSTQAVFFDMDNDGDLDMFLLNHNIKKIDNLEFAQYQKETDEFAGDKLFENREGHFTDISKKAGIRQNPLTFGLGIAIADIDLDGWEDIYVTNDYNEQDYVYINNHNGTFTERSKEYFRHLSQFSMGVDIADINNDGLPDLITLDMLPEDNRRQKLLQLQENYENFQLTQDQGLHKQYMRNMLQLNNGNGSFSEIAQLAGVSNTDWSWCPLFADFDNDGFKDLFVSNGYFRDYTNKDFLRYWGDYKVKKAVDREPVQLLDLIKAMPVTRYPNYIFRNDQHLGFINKQKEWGLDQPKISNGAAYADLDNDGDLELIINNLNQEAFIYKNQSREKEQTNYADFQLTFKKQNSFAIGSKIYLYAGGQVQYQELCPYRGYLSCVSAIVHFGLNKISKIDSVKIIWPNGRVQKLSNIPANQITKIAYQENQAVESRFLTTAAKTIFRPAPDFIGYRHEGFGENDFKRQLLMNFMYSQSGPIIAKADVNKDGLDDVFISGDKNKAGKIYLQNKTGGFLMVEGTDIGNEDSSSVSDAVFFDANGDGNIDLYVTKGGYSLFEVNSVSLQDELYLGDGKGKFIADKNALPNLTASSKSCVRPADIDGDGDIDLFVGGHVIPGQYPVAPRSFLLVNNGKGQFVELTTPFDSIGMVTDAQWADLNGDGKMELIICGEFMPIKVFGQQAGSFTDQTSQYFTNPESGLWFGLCVKDLDGDGKPDIIAGNLGRNTQVHFSEKEPAVLYYADFDGNGSIDPFLTFYVQGKAYPYVSRDELNEQIYPMRRKFRSYKEYADAAITDIFTPAELANAHKLTATECNSSIFFNRNGKFQKTTLPLTAQFSMVTKIVCDDFDGDSKTDLLLLGNHSDNRLKIGSIDANYGCLLKGDGHGNFDYLPQTVSGLNIKGDVKSAIEIKVAGKNYLLVAMPNSELNVFESSK